jgi:hypothetical protein
LGIQNKYNFNISRNTVSLAKLRSLPWAERWSIIQKMDTMSFYSEVYAFIEQYTYFDLTFVIDELYKRNIQPEFLKKITEIDLDFSIYKNIPETLDPLCINYLIVATHKSKATPLLVKKELISLFEDKMIAAVNYIKTIQNKLECRSLMYFIDYDYKLCDKVKIGKALLKYKDDRWIDQYFINILNNPLKKNLLPQEVVNLYNRIKVISDIID